MNFGVAGGVRKIVRGLRHPITWLIVQAVLVGVFLSSSGGLAPLRVPDSKSYILTSRFETAQEVLSYYRSYGYGVLLRFAATDGNSFPTRWVRIPPIQLSVYLAAMLVWWAAVRAFTGSRWLAFAAATPLPYLDVVDLVNRVQPDFLAAAFVIISFSLLLLVVRRPASWWLLSLLGLSLFCSYQMRPAGVFLVGLIPVMAAFLTLVVERASLRRALLAALRVAIVCAGPLLAFSGLRWVAVGHFGLVAFGGPNLTGVTANFVDAELLGELPAEHRELAAMILRMRQKRGWSPMRTDADPGPWFEQYSENMFKIALPAMRIKLEREAGELKEAGDMPPQLVTDWWLVVNKRLTEFSRSVIRLRPRLYLRWVTGAIWHGVRQLKDQPWILWPFALVLLSGPYALARHRRAHRENSCLRPLLGLGALALSYFAGYLLLVSLVSHPFLRYFASMVLLVPGSLCALLVWIWIPWIRCRPFVPGAGADAGQD